jgi:hypothetical protein
VDVRKESGYALVVDIEIMAHRVERMAREYLNKDNASPQQVTLKDGEVMNHWHTALMCMSCSQVTDGIEHIIENHPKGLMMFEELPIGSRGGNHSLYDIIHMSSTPFFGIVFDEFFLLFRV